MCDSHRRITSLSHLGKVYTRILEKRLRACVESLLNDYQCGLHPARTIDAIFVVKMLLEKIWG